MTLEYPQLDRAARSGVEAFIDAIRALPVHQISGYEWECYEPDTGCHWHFSKDTPCDHGPHPVDHEGNYDRDGVPCEHDRLVDLDRILAIGSEIGSE